MSAASFQNVRLKMYCISIDWGFLGSSAGKESTCNAGDPGSIPGSGRSPEERIGYPLQYSCLVNPHGQRSLLGYSPWSRKESDMPEQLSTAINQLKMKLRTQLNLQQHHKE